MFSPLRPCAKSTSNRPPRNEKLWESACRHACPDATFFFSCPPSRSLQCDEDLPNFRAYNEASHSGCLHSRLFNKPAGFNGDQIRALPFPAARPVSITDTRRSALFYFYFCNLQSALIDQVLIPPSPPLRLPPIAMTQITRCSLGTSPSFSRCLLLSAHRLETGIQFHHPA